MRNSLGSSKQATNVSYSDGRDESVFFECRIGTVMRVCRQLQVPTCSSPLSGSRFGRGGDEMVCFA